MNNMSSQIRNVLIPTRLFGQFHRHVRWEIDRNVEVMELDLGIGLCSNNQEEKP